MTNTIAICGATGQQGGSVVKALLKAGNWKIRAVTRNKESKPAQALIAEGVEVVTADLDDEESLIKAFEGVQVIFAVTNFWEMMATKGGHAAGQHEKQQSLNLAHAAAKTSSLKHYVFSTLPGTMGFSGGKHFVPHMEYKAQVDEYIKNELPELAAKTTFLWIGWYPSNMAYMPLIKPMEVPLSGKYIWMQPSPAKALLPIAGDIGNNVGVFVRAILSHPELTLPSRYVTVKTETLSFEDILKIWTKVTGKVAEYVDVSGETFGKLWGTYGEEMSLQFGFGAEYGDWDVLKPGMAGVKELGIEEGELRGLEETLEGLKGLLT